MRTHPRIASHARLILCVVAVLALAALASACSDDDGDAAPATVTSDRLDVVVTIIQIDALTREVGGDLIDLHGLVPVGADAHEFEPVASDLQAIENADLIMRHGIGIDDWLDDTLAAGAGAAVVTITDGIELQRPALEQAEEGAEQPGSDDGGFDPHVWHDPDRAKIMVDNIAAALRDADPANAGTYASNAEAYKRTLDQTRDDVQEIINEIPPADRKLVTNHDAFGYFAGAFGLEIVGSVIPSTTTESEPSAADTAALLETINREGVKAIFAESSVNPELARTLAQDAGVTIVDDLYGDSLGEPGSGAETVHGMLLANARKIADALR